MLEILIILVIVIAFILFCNIDCDKLILQFIYGKGAEDYLDKRKNYYGHKLYLVIIDIMLLLLLISIPLFLFFLILPGEYELISGFIFIGVPIVISGIWTVIARTRRKKHPEWEAEESQEDLSGPTTDKEREEFLKERNHLDESI